MAKRPADDFDPFDDPFESDIDSLRIDDASIDSLRIDDSADDFDLGVEDADIKDAVRASKPSVYRPRPTPGQIILGVIQVIVFAVIFLVIFLALGFGAVFGGQKVGLVATRAPGGSGPLISLLPTAGAPANGSSADAATAPPNAATATPIPPTPTIDTTCASAADWWKGVEENYQYFAAAALNEARGSDRIPALLEKMGYRRSFVANYQPDGQPLPACLNDAQAALLKGFDATIEAARAIGSKDDAALATQQDAATSAFQEVAADLSKYGVSVNLSVVATPSA